MQKHILKKCIFLQNREEDTNMNMKHMLISNNRDADKKLLDINTLGTCYKNMASLYFKKQKQALNLYSHAHCEPDLFWRSKCVRQGGRSLNERCTIENPRRIK